MTISAVSVTPTGRQQQGTAEYAEPVSIDAFTLLVHTHHCTKETVAGNVPEGRLPHFSYRAAAGIGL